MTQETTQQKIEQEAEKSAGGLIDREWNNRFDGHFERSEHIEGFKVSYHSFIAGYKAANGNTEGEVN